MKKIKEKHVERLMKGRKSGVNIGSRQVPHHLFAHEQTQFELAIKYGFLTIKEETRVNLLNLWEKYCAAQNRSMLVLKKYNNGTAEIWTDYHVETFEHAADGRAAVILKAKQV